jgi:predicted transcriptional regulator
MANCVIERYSCDSSSLKSGSPWQLNLSKKYRSHFEIIASILDATKCNSGDRYFLMKHTGINYAQLKKYLGSLIRMGFVEIRMREQRILYCATEKGLAFLSQYYVLLEMLINAYAPTEQGRAICEPAYAPLSKHQAPQ